MLSFREDKVIGDSSYGDEQTSEVFETSEVYCTEINLNDHTR